MAEMIQGESLRKSYGNTEVLRGIDFTVHEGSVVCVIGPSGSGKTTLLRCVNQLEQIDSGALRIDGALLGYRIRDGRAVQLPDREIARQRRATGMVFQRFNLFPHLTALGNVIEGPIQVAGRERAEASGAGLALLDRVGLADRADAYPAELSGGQQQRVAIARALAMQPKVLLFDEPTSALDPELVSEVLLVMRDLAASGMTMMVVTHEIAFARDVADQVLFMADGRVVERGLPDEVLSRPSTDRLRAFLASVT